MKYLKYALGAILILIVINGCSKATMIRKYYVLEPHHYFRAIDFDLKGPFEKKIDVREFNVAKPFSQTRIATRSASHEMNYFQYHHWATRPPSAITYMVYRLIENSNVFQKTSYGFSVDADYIVSGDIHKLEIIDKGKKMYAHLGMTFRFIDRKTNRPEVRYDFDREVKLVEKSMNLFAWAVSEILREETQEFFSRVTDFLKAEEVNNK